MSERRSSRWMVASERWPVSGPSAWVSRAWRLRRSSATAVAGAASRSVSSSRWRRPARARLLPASASSSAVCSGSRAMPERRTTGARVKPWTTRVTTTTPVVRVRTRERKGSGAAAAGRQRDGQGGGQRHDAAGAGPDADGGDAPGDALCAAAVLDDRGQREDPQEPHRDDGGGHGQGTQRPAAFAGGEVPDEGGQLQADEGEDDTFQEEDESGVDGLHLHAYGGVGQFVARAADDHPGDDHGGHPGGVQIVRRHVGRVRGDQGDDRLQDRVLGAAPDQCHQARDERADERAAAAEENELTGRPRQGEGAGGHGGADGHFEQDQAGGVVEQALRLHQDLQPGRQGQPAAQRGDRDRVGAGQDRTQDERHRQRQRRQGRRPRLPRPRPRPGPARTQGPSRDATPCADPARRWSRRRRTAAAAGPRRR